MWIERVQVDEGFLDGLDLRLSEGLNVIIGARGVGKTSILELVRYALRLEHVDQRRSVNARQHAEAVLAGGRVVVTFNHAGTRKTVARSATDFASVEPLLPVDTAPLMLGQSELEGIGLDPRSRLRLIDAQAGVDRREVDEKVITLQTEVVSLTSQLRTLSVQREGLRQQEAVRPRIEEELREARAREAELIARAGQQALGVREEIRTVAERVSGLESQRARLQELREMYSDAMERSSGVLQFLEERQTDFRLVDTEQASHEGTIASIRSQQSRVSGSLESAIATADAEIADVSSQMVAANEEMRPLRRAFDEYEAGAATAAQETARLERQLNEIDAGLERLEVLRDRVEGLTRRRAELMAQVDSLREQMWTARIGAAAKLTEDFAPRIQVLMEHYGDRAAYTGELASALRGSGLQHNQLADWLTERMSPHELVAAVETGDSARLSVMGELTSSRVDKLVAHLAQAEGLGEILTAELEDRADFQLLVGRDYRDSEILSTGQRCSVVLPLLLADAHRVLLLDQPEDHLDNAYLVDNTIRSLLTRNELTQTIVATHNANIPVLGDASLVVCMDSDGRRGYVSHEGPLGSPHIVDLITQLMEGGQEAFRQRAAFYGRWHGDL